MRTIPDWPIESRESEFDLGRVLGAFRRHALLLLGTVVLMTAATAFVTSRLEPSYAASATLLIEPHQLRVLRPDALVEGSQPFQSGVEIPLATQVNILTSRSQAERVVDMLRLDDLEEFRPQPGMLAQVDIAAAWEHVQRFGVAVGLANGSEGESGSMPEPVSAAGPLDETERRRHAVDHLLDNLQVYRDGQSQALVVRYTAGEAELAASVANAVVETYLRDQVVKKVDTVDTAERWVRERIATLREELLVAEREIERFRVANDLLESRDGTLETQQLVSLNNQLIAASAERMAAEARLARIREILAAGGAEAVAGQIASSPLAANLRQQAADLQRSEAQMAQEYGAQHPRMLQLRAEQDELERKLEDEVARIISGIADEVALARSRERSIVAGLADAKGASAGTQQAAVQLRELEREAAARRSLYEAMLARLQEIQEQRDLVRPDARIVSSAAVPKKPSFPRPPIMLVAGFLGSLGLGVVLVTIAELRDRTLRSSRQIATALGLPTLALVPKIDGLRRGALPTRHLVEQPGSAYGEALRELEAMQRATPRTGQGAELVLVTSSLPGEGKTSLATGLALTAANAGRRTILVDLDMRRPSVEAALGIADGKPLTVPMLDFLVLGDAARQGSGRSLVHPRTLERLIERLRASYDLIIVDTAPVLGLADTKLITRLADQVLFVVRWSSTPAEAARSAFDSLASLGARISGVVLTQVDLRRHARYGYGDAVTYYHRYRQYYVG